MTFLLMFVAGVVLLLCGLLLVLLARQNGRILIRLEAVEQELAQLRRQASADTPSSSPAGLPSGTPAPAFELPTLDGTVLTLNDLRGKKALLVFFDEACGFCRNMTPQLAGIDTAKAGSTRLVLISSGDPEKTRKLLAEHRVRVTVALQKKTEISELYRATGTPTGYLIDENGVLASDLAVGATALLRLLDSPGAVPRLKGARPLTESRITRTGLPAGTMAPLFRLPRLDGGELSLSEYKGRKVLLVLSDPRCGPCTQLASQLEQYHRQRSDIQILMVSRGDLLENQRKATELGLTFPVGLQRQWEISRDYGMFSTPIGFLIDEYGVIARNVAVGADAIMSVLRQPATASST